MNCLNLKCLRKQLLDWKKKQEHLPTEEPLFKRYTWDPLNSGWAGICWKKTLYSYELSTLAYEWTWGWGWPCFDTTPLSFLWKFMLKILLSIRTTSINIMGCNMHFNEKVTHWAQISCPRVVKSCLIHSFLSPLLHEQIQIHRQYAILGKTCFCNRIKLNHKTTKGKIESTRKHRRFRLKILWPTATI